MRAAVRGDPAGVDWLFREHWPAAYRSAWLIVRDEAAAEDIAQEGFLAALRALDRFDRTRPFGPWLRTIVAAVRSTPRGHGHYAVRSARSRWA